METRNGGEFCHLYGPRSSDLSGLGARNAEWNINDWRWDGDLFLASPLNSASTDCKSKQFFPFQVARNSSNSSSCSDEAQVEREQRDVDKRRRVCLVEDDGPGSLTLKLGGHGYSESEQGHTEENGRKSKLISSVPNRAVCQVEDCLTDLSNAKDYHRRHKVCEIHSKASRALVGNIWQRFCQQCSRFHALQEFDEGKRSCRRRLAGHNKRRRKTQPEAVTDGNSIKDDHASGYILVTLLKLLSNMHSGRMEQTKDQDLVSCLLRNLLSQISKNDGISGQNVDILSSILSTHPQFKSNEQSHSPPHDKPTQAPHEDDSGVQAKQLASEIATSFGTKNDPPLTAEALDCSVARTNNFDLNDAYIDLDTCAEDIERFPATKNPEAPFESPSSAPRDSNLSSPPQTSGRSDSISTHSPSTSGGDGQGRTDRIIFKLFGKEPADFPAILRTQILEWLSHSPTDIESYIRPGCVILTIYVHMPKTSWEELCGCLRSSLSRLVSIYDTFWGSGWVYVRVQNQVAFIFNGQVVLDTLLPFTLLNRINIRSIKPIAVTASERVKFTVNSTSFLRPTTRLHCAVDGKYLVPEFIECPDGHDNRQHLCFSCLLPLQSGRGFIEVEDTVLGNSFFPFIVADKDVCSEIRMLECLFDSKEINEDICRSDGRLSVKNQAMNFVHEMGWLLHRCHFKSSSKNSNAGTFSVKRFIYLVEFAVDHDWCAVVRKLLDVLLDGIVAFNEHGSLDSVLSEMSLLHRAVRRNCRPLVELLLKYDPRKMVSNSLNARRIEGIPDGALFKPDVAGPAGLTPLHIAAGRDAADDIVDALTDDPGLVGIKAWNHRKDTTGCTPEDYARMRGHYSYIHLVQRKISKYSMSGQVVVDIPAVYADKTSKQTGGAVSSLEIGKAGPQLNQGPCPLCRRKLGMRPASKPLVYRPAMLSLLAIAAVCVCVALLMKSLPEVLYLFRPFRWELLEYGSC